MDTEKETDADVEESDEWFYNYFGRDNIAKEKEEVREEERRKNILTCSRCIMRSPLSRKCSKCLRIILSK